jgi:hypothetical protein
MEMRNPLRKTTQLYPWLALLLILGAAGTYLRLQGRPWWCACGRWYLWVGDIWSAHNSQHLLDPYSFSHLLHGVVFCGLIFWLFRRLSGDWKFVLAAGAEALWEMAENSQFIIERYRAATISLGYSGDSILNSFGDLLCCSLGYLAAHYLGWRRSILLFVLVEVGMLFWVRDNLTLNVLMLLYPIDAIKAWQFGH